MGGSSIFLLHSSVPPIVFLRHLFFLPERVFLCFPSPCLFQGRQRRHQFFPSYSDWQIWISSLWESWKFQQRWYFLFLLSLFHPPSTSKQVLWSLQAPPFFCRFPVVSPLHIQQSPFQRFPPLHEEWRRLWWSWNRSIRSHPLLRMIWSSHQPWLLPGGLYIGKRVFPPPCFFLPLHGRYISCQKMKKSMKGRRME